MRWLFHWLRRRSLRRVQLLDHAHEGRNGDRVPIGTNKRLDWLR